MLKIKINKTIQKAKIKNLKIINLTLYIMTNNSKIKEKDKRKFKDKNKNKNKNNTKNNQNNNKIVYKKSNRCFFSSMKDQKPKFIPNKSQFNLPNRWSSNIRILSINNKP